MFAEQFLKRLEEQGLLDEAIVAEIRKQMEEADIIVLNKIDLLTEQEKDRLLSAIGNSFPDKMMMAVSAKEGSGMDEWLADLFSGRPGSNTVLRQIDYDRYASAEAVLGWLNAAVKMTATKPFDTSEYLRTLAVSLRERFKHENGEIGHLKFVITASGKSMWANLTHLAAEPTLSGESLGNLPQATLIINARVRLEPEELEAIVRDRLNQVSADLDVQSKIDDLQCFSPAYPEPPHIIREAVD